MLSRIAESLFWIGRYVERAEGTARMLDVNISSLVTDPWADEDLTCRGLLAVLGCPEPTDAITRDESIQRLLIERNDPASVAFCFEAARENARRIREVISAEFWEALNTNRAKLPKQVRPGREHGVFVWVRHQSMLALSIADASMIHDEGWQYMTLGRALERADMTSRLIASRGVPAKDARTPNWVEVLRACGGYESFLRAQRGVISDRSVAEFLVRGRVFPRSVLASLDQAMESLVALEPDRSRTLVPGGAIAVLGRARSDLAYVPAVEIAEDLQGWMHRLQDAVVAATEAVRRTYFPDYIQPVWSGSSTWLD
ncbi:MAG: alpha-E domain-containing protein [Galactobacter sp.]